MNAAVNSSVELVIGGFPPNFNAEALVPTTNVPSLLGTATDADALVQFVPSQSSVTPGPATAIAAVCKAPLPPATLLLKLLTVVHEVPLYASVAVGEPKANPAVCVPAPPVALLPVFKVLPAVQLDPSYS